MTLRSKLSSFHKKSALLTQKLWFIMLASSLVGALLFVIIYGVRILDPTYDDWLLQGGDLTQHYVGWLFLRRSDWQFPFGLIDGVLGNIKVSVMYTDSVPLLAVFFKLLSPLLPETFQYYGLLGLGSFMLSGACAALLIHRFSSNGLFCILGHDTLVLSGARLGQKVEVPALSAAFVGSSRSPCSRHAYILPADDLLLPRGLLHHGYFQI